MAMLIARPGFFTTVQDRGRTGNRQYGVVVSGAMDDLSLRLGNWLVGNEGGTGALEMTMTGANVQFDEPVFVAFTGAEANIECQGKSIPMWRPVYIPPRSEVHVKRLIQGSRVYLSIAGGVDVPKVLGSRSTYTRGQFGGFEGRALKKGDVLSIGYPSETIQAVIDALPKEAARILAMNWGIAPSVYHSLKNTCLRCMEGSEYSYFTATSQQDFWRTSYKITPESDRMGFRLDGARLEMSKSKEMISEAVAIGTIQVPASGQPIILMADGQTTGGYPKIANVATVDIPSLAQKIPGAEVYFEYVTLEEAQQLYIQREYELQMIRAAIQLKWRKEKEQ
ncbi:biotin-dependent carboxyltransferase family protein [Bacillus sp. FJAT-42315]|uniref:5-oxoprolinase subunit C family protein n=1 Tax=Bacillus sp. FJAT-42315 TaxID=2014077 RepID=UPI000C24388A|nr:biotin-dependent carboxyltransferase family protein [Bacillus sp. FJAT-42315]